MACWNFMVPPAFTAASDEDASVWCRNTVSRFVESDLPQFGVNVATPTMLRFWPMLAHVHGNVWNAADPARSLGVSEPTVRRYLDWLTQTFMIRQFLRITQPADAYFWATHTGAEPFVQGLAIIEREASDERNFVKKAVNMALRAIGKRNRALNFAAVVSGAAPGGVERCYGEMGGQRCTARTHEFCGDEAPQNLSVGIVCTYNVHV